MAEPTAVAVLGAGRVGAAIARDLAADPGFRVTAVDASEEALARLADRADERDPEAGGGGSPPWSSTLETAAADLTDPEAIDRVVEDAEIVVGAVPGPMGYRTLRRIIEAGRDAVDISFFEEDALGLDALARERGVTALVDAGLAPGLSNLVLGRLLEAWDAVHQFECLVGGLPVDRSAPFEYRAPFSPLDVLAEYTRPARIRRDGEPLTLPALSEVEEVDVPGVGILEAFLTDGLRTLLDTTDVPTMVEKTMRYPGHAAAMRGLREAGFFERDPVRLGEGGAESPGEATDGTNVRPLELTGRLLTDAWRMEPDDEDLVAMRITLEGEDGGEPVRRRWRLLDRYDPETGTTAMARTTGYTCTACVRMLARGLYDEPGITPLETVGRVPACFDFVVEELAARGIELEAP